MKKLLFALSIIVFLAVGCNQPQKNTNQSPEASSPKENPVSSSTVLSTHTYSSQKLGVSFQYDSPDENGNLATVEEDGSTIYVYLSNHPELKQDQSVQVFSKDKSETLDAAIKRLIFKNNFPKCSIDPALPSTYRPDNSKGNFVDTALNPGAEVITDMTPEMLSNCPSQYFGYGNFQEDLNYPDKFIYIHRSMEDITANNSISWNQTIQFHP